MFITITISFNYELVPSGTALQTKKLYKFHLLMQVLNNIQ